MDSREADSDPAGERRPALLRHPLLVAVVVAAVSGAISAWFTSRSVEQQLNQALTQDDLTARRTTYLRFVEAEAAFSDRTGQLFTVADEVARGQATLADSMLVTQTSWNPAGYRLDPDDFAEGQEMQRAMAALELWASEPLALCAERLVLVTWVLLYETSNLAKHGTLEWMETVGFQPLPAPYPANLAYLKISRSMGDELRERVREHLRTDLGRGDETPPGCGDLPTHVRGGSTRCEGTGGDCRDLTIGELEAAY